jgi:hypothetical protein
MTWDKPKSGRGWLLLFAPAGICVLSTLAGGLFDRNDGDWMAWGLVGLLIATFCSVALSILLARGNSSIGAKVGCALICFAILMVVNLSVSFAGCALGSTVFPGLNLR